MNDTNDTNDEVENFNIKKALYIIKKYSKSIILIVVLFIIASVVIAYFKPSMYFSTAILQVKKEGSARGNSLMLSAIGYGEESAGAESVLNSKYLIFKMLDNMKLDTRYFTKRKFKTTELYKESPFIVSVTSLNYKLLDKKLKIKPIDEETFELSYKTKMKFTLSALSDLVLMEKKEEINYIGIHKFSEEIITKYFRFKVSKLREFSQREYYFSYSNKSKIADYIQRHLSTSADAKYSSNIFIRFDDTVALRAKEIVDSLTKTYIKDAMEQKKASSDMSLKFIDNQLAVINKTLTNSEKVLQGYKQNNDLISLNSKAANVSENVQKLEEELNNLSSEESVLENLQEYINKNEDLTGLTVQPLKITATNLNELILNYQTAVNKRRGMLAAVTEFHPEILKLNEDVYSLRKNIQATVRLSLQTLKSRKEYLRESLKIRKNSLIKLPKQERELGVLTRNSAVNQNIYEFLLQKRVETAILNSSTLSNARLMDEATFSNKPYAPNKLRFILMGTLFGLIVGIALSFLRASFNNVINDIEELEGIKSLPIYGKIPYNKKKMHSISYEEAFRTLRTNLEFIKIDKSSKTVLVASSISGEGKSTTIKNMAEMLVKLNKKVVVLDFDLRRPSLHTYFKSINNEIGLSMLLSGQSNLQESIQKTVDNINVITAGPIPPNPSEIIMGEGTDLLLKTLSKTYDYILIDTPPYSVVTDASILIKEADIVLFSIMNEYSNRNCIAQMKEIVSSYDIKSAGIIYHGLKLKKREQQGYGYFDK